MKRLAGGGRGAWAAATVAALGGCTTLLGADKDYHGVESAGGGGATSANVTSASVTSASAMSSSGTGGAGGATSSSATSTSATSSSGTGGACVPLTDKRCAGNLPQSCDANGQWHDEAPCTAQMPLCTAGACGVPPSCSGLPPTCGPAGNESCCASPVVTGGTYNRSNDDAYPATVSDFRLDRFEITVGRFRQFLASYPGNKPTAGAGAHPLLMGSGWQPGWNASLPVDQDALKTAVKCSPHQTWTDSVGGNESQPMNCINWYEAFAFCAWDGARLATEAEGNYAAAGGNEQRVYPWGATAPDKLHAVYDCMADGSGSGQCASTDILNVGSRSMIGDGKWGQADLAGGVWEWNLDWYVTPYAIAACIDCATLSQGNATSRRLQGGAWDIDASFLSSFFRGNNVPIDHSQGFGARCARSP